MSITRPTHSALAALDRAPVWLNTEPLTAEGLRGHVVLVDFWTYTCVNWLRTLPYVRAWHERYRDRGLVVVGAHAPEFSFEHDLANVRRAIAELDVTYPVVIDNDFDIWQSFGNHYWPAVYLVDRDGRTRYHHFGEEAYADTELAIQGLLDVDEPVLSLDVDGFSVAADWDGIGSGETYVGAARGNRPAAAAIGELVLNQWTLAGEWSVGAESAVLDAAPGSVAYRFAARDVNMVLAPPASGAAGFTVRVDGAAPGESHGVDVDASGAGTLDEPRMYQLVRRHGGASERTFEIAFDAPGVSAYVFTFG
jgi:thiol-disulfide isomerase/thioredoxin